MEEAVVESRPCWFVGTLRGQGDDRLQEFMDEGIWVNGYEDKYTQQVKSMQVGDRIAIKASYVRKHNLPFDNRGVMVSVMAIKALGTITDNPGNGQYVKVDWVPLAARKEWYFYTGRTDLWKVIPTKDWMSKALIDFTFADQPQDIERFKNAPYWSERFGDQAKAFEWTAFYEEMADKLLVYQHDRTPLIQAIHAMAENIPIKKVLKDEQADGTTLPLADICPFSVLALFNRRITNANRRLIAEKLAEFLGVTSPVPHSFTAVPMYYNQALFFNYANKRKEGDIDLLWQVMATAIAYADSMDEGDSEEADFLQAYDAASQASGNLTYGLYWIRPWKFLLLDKPSSTYIQQHLALEIGRDGAYKRCSAENYLHLSQQLANQFTDGDYSVHSFPELSYAASRYAPAERIQGHSDDVMDDEDAGDPEVITPEPYSLEDITNDGCFIDPERLSICLERLRTKKNIILQGPPGAGKTWLAKRLAYALMGEKSEHQLRAVQFDPNLSYEDFVRGWRPSGDGKLALADGVLLDMVQEAKRHPDKTYVLVIEEINRGNPAQIFGEMLTLLEADKRTPSEALSLCYRRDNEPRVYIPPNLYVIGTMNIADRSLALVDFALRRRFAFIDLKPELGSRWLAWMSKHSGIETPLLERIQQRMNDLNAELSADSSLGEQFQIGHSYVTLTRSGQVNDAHSWFEQVVDTEIVPLLKEYWFDAPQKVAAARKKLLAD